jgi:DNA-binding MarR family transcriptional regulator
MYLAVMDASVVVSWRQLIMERAPCRSPTGDKAQFTELQGQYLAFIYAYTKVNRRPPAQADLQRHFHVTPPTVHQMVLTLERLGHLRRIPGRARALEVLVAVDELPVLR